jgi:putative membrane protein (TIGR04086 family)
MNFIKKTSKSWAYTFGIIAVVTLITTILNYFNILSYQIVNIIKVITIVLSFLVGGILIGRLSTTKAWLEGIKLSIMFILTLTILNLFMHTKMDWRNLIYYLIVSISTTLGSMIGINTVDTKKST